jgi:hypothetical protein
LCKRACLQIILQYDPLMCVAGVGKSELAKTLASYYFGSEEAMVRLDMSEFMERHTVSKLIGSPPGAPSSLELALL